MEISSYKCSLKFFLYKLLAQTYFYSIFLYSQFFNEYFERDNKSLRFDKHCLYRGYKIYLNFLKSSLPFSFITEFDSFSIKYFSSL